MSITTPTTTLPVTSPVAAFQDFFQLDMQSLRSLCTKLGIPKGSRNEMIQNLSALVQHQPRTRKRTRHSFANSSSSSPSSSSSSSSPNHLLSKRKGRSKLPKQVKRTTTARSVQLDSQPLSPASAAIIIQKWYRTHRWTYTNDTDFLSLEPLVNCSIFRLVEDQKNVFQFNPVSLAQYFISEGKFANPYTRRPLYTVELMRLDKAVKKVDKSWDVNLVKIRKQLAIKRAQEREHERTCNLLHADSLNLLTDIIRMTRGGRRNNRQIDMKQAMFELCNVALPRYFHTFRQLYILDYNFAADSILYMCQALKQMWVDSSVASTEERCCIIETAQNSIVKFCKELLPIFSMFVDMPQDGISSESEPVR